MPIGNMFITKSCLCLQGIKEVKEVRASIMSMTDEEPRIYWMPSLAWQFSVFDLYGILFILLTMSLMFRWKGYNLDTKLYWILNSRMVFFFMFLCIPFFS